MEKITTGGSEVLVIGDIQAEADWPLGGNAVMGWDEQDLHSGWKNQLHGL